MTDYYSILNISQNATEDDIKKSYKRLALKYHPDKNPNNLIAEEHFKLINEAYQVLSNKDKKAQYDNMLLYNSYSGSTHTTTYTTSPKKRREKPKYHTRRVNYKFDNEYFRIQRIIVVIFVVMVGSAYLLSYIKQYYKEKGELEEIHLEAKSIDSLNGIISNKQYEKAVEYSIYLVNNYPLTYKYYYKKDSVLNLLTKASKEHFNNKDYLGALKMFKILQNHDTIQFDNVLDEMLYCFINLEMKDSAIWLLKRKIEKNENDLKSYFLLSKIYFEEFQDIPNSLFYINRTKTIFKTHMIKYFGEGFEFIIAPEKTPDIYFDLFLLRAKINLAATNYEEAYSDCNWAVFFRAKKIESYYLRIESGIKSKQPFRVCEDLEMLTTLGETDIKKDFLEHCAKKKI
ncbi:MAG: DnaJ domain-containing protein [Cyclobacteriaceae bacterium]|nr:DnaJ domain-containing protein [Cyclobacteriaceae bacterium]